MQKVGLQKVSLQEVSLQKVSVQVSSQTFRQDRRNKTSPQIVPRR